MSVIGDVTKFFNNIKFNLKAVNSDDKKHIVKKLGKLSKEASELGQDRMLKKLALEYKWNQREIKEVLPAGYTKYVEIADIKKYIDVLADNKVRNLKFIYLSDFIREIPDKQAKIIKKARNAFDDILILYTDYTDEVDKEVKVERDPIAFGVLSNHENHTMCPRVYYITDWVDEYCDLTLSKFIDEYKEYVDTDDEVVRSGIELLQNKLKGSDTIE